MRVMCIKKLVIKTERHLPDGPKVGDIDTVIDDQETYGELFYLLDRFGWSVAFKASHFAILPESTADELQEAEQEAILM
jgi:hypothetical protein